MYNSTSRWCNGNASSIIKWIPSPSLPSPWLLHGVEKWNAKVLLCEISSRPAMRMVSKGHMPRSYYSRLLIQSRRANLDLGSNASLTKEKKFRICRQAWTVVLRNHCLTNVKRAHNTAQRHTRPRARLLVNRMIIYFQRREKTRIGCKYFSEGPEFVRNTTCAARWGIRFTMRCKVSWTI